MAKNYAGLRAIARRYREGEEIAAYGHNALDRFMGVMLQIEAQDDARKAGFTHYEMLDEVAQIDVEEEDVQ